MLCTLKPILAENDDDSLRTCSCHRSDFAFCPFFLRVLDFLLLHPLVFVFFAGASYFSTYTHVMESIPTKRDIAYVWLLLWRTRSTLSPNWWGLVMRWFGACFGWVWPSHTSIPCQIVAVSKSILQVNCEVKSGASPQAVTSKDVVLRASGHEDCWVLPVFNYLDPLVRVTHHSNEQVNQDNGRHE